VEQHSRGLASEAIPWLINRKASTACRYSTRLLNIKNNPFVFGFLLWICLSGTILGHLLYSLAFPQKYFSRPLKHWNRGFQSYSRNGCLSTLIACLCCVWVATLRLADIPSKDSYWQFIKFIFSDLIANGNKPQSLIHQGRRIRSFSASWPIDKTCTQESQTVSSNVLDYT
jgi:hypothetical protein